MNTLHPGDEIELDTTGFYYSIIASERHPGTFGITVRLKEDIIPEILQKACDKLFHRLSNFNVALKRYYNRDVNLVLSDPIWIQEDLHPENFTAYFQPGECTTRVLYGKNYFSMEVLHSVCDGGTLVKACKALTIEYFRQQGLDVPYMEIDLDSPQEEEEYENAQRKYANPDGDKAPLKEIHPFPIAGTPIPSILKQYQISVSKLKPLAKEKGVTITEYMVAMLILEIDKERKAKKDTSPILISIPFDMRKFYPTKCLRNFVISITVSVDQFNSLDELLQDVHTQMKQFDFEGASKILNATGDATQIKRELPYEERKKIMEYADEHLAGGTTMTTVLSNVGVIRFPEAIQDKVDYLDFVLCPCPSVAYQLSCVTYRDVLALSLTSAIKETEMIDRFVKSLQEKNK